MVIEGPTHVECAGGILINLLSALVILTRALASLQGNKARRPPRNRDSEGFGLIPRINLARTGPKAAYSGCMIA